MPNGERSGLQTHIVVMESGTSCERMKKLTAFPELEKAVCLHLLGVQIKR
jgi:hypothetical protein